ncbi:hypothetical protein K9N68_26190 [Kovacikia minuta CCNUW1]|uniref:hypothetical protein n=1 Tax=Kovacikia minuta TaxID=2931930 RepID=UPI001CCD5525|nr:hypothetical protein [Kovacikia minuta]UBF25094.1 hypothetical protein K9N68_26190 [Kovacikia minuta CCNUW1]
MLFAFPPLIQAGIDAGKYEVVKNAAGVVMGTAREKATGHFVGNAVGILSNSGVPFNPISVPLQFAQMYQTRQGFQAVQVGLQGIQASLGVLQTMTALTGIGVAANLAISAVSLWQILKLREDVKLQRIEMREGFLDLKQVLRDQGTEIIQKIDEAVQDIEFRNHRQALAQAYGRFVEATRLMKSAISCEDLNVRNADLANVRQILTEALADYKNPHLLPEANSVTQLRRSECIWAIEQTIAITYQLQNQPEALSICLGQLQERIHQDVLEVVERCESEDELDIIFPEITRIHDQDLIVLKVWQEQVDWVRSLPPSEQKLLRESDVSQPEITETSFTVDLTAIPPEQLLYETLKQKSHFPALCDALRLMMHTETRREYETYINQQAKNAQHKALTVANLQQMSDLSVANLYWYFQVRDESEQELTEEKVMQT